MAQQHEGNRGTNRGRKQQVGARKPPQVDRPEERDEDEVYPNASPGEAEQQTQEAEDEMERERRGGRDIEREQEDDDSGRQP